MQSQILAILSKDLIPSSYFVVSCSAQANQHSAWIHEREQEVRLEQKSKRTSLQDSAMEKIQLAAHFSIQYCRHALDQIVGSCNGLDCRHPFLYMCSPLLNDPKHWQTQLLLWDAPKIKQMLSIGLFPCPEVLLHYFLKHSLQLLGHIR